MARRTTKKTPRRRAAARRSRAWQFGRFIALRLALGLLALGIVSVVLLDLHIRRQFADSAQAQPARVYARPTELTPGMALAADALQRQLSRLGYRQVERIRQPGSFARRGEVMDVFLRAVSVDRVARSAIALRLQFRRERLLRLSNHATGKPPPAPVLLEPEVIDNLQLGPYRDRVVLQLPQIPEQLVSTLLAMEDRRFASHVGVDPGAIARALWHNLRQGQSGQGGSTLTQQLVKNVFLTPERTLSRKILEALMALILERRYSKSEILTRYVNEIFLGQAGNRAIHGFALAGEFYFGRPLRQLKLHEIATLVGMIAAPSYYNPHRHPQRTLKRRNLVLMTLARVGSISRSNAQELAALPLGVIRLEYKTASRYPAYIDYLHRQLRRYYPEDVLRSSGLRLHTSLDLGIQAAAQHGLSTALAQLDRQRGFKPGTLQGAALVIGVKNGEILALVSDRTAGAAGFNRAIDAHRPIGSLIKPVVYLTALQRPRRYSLATPLADTPLTVATDNGQPWSPKNYDNQYRGSTLAIEALTRSYNVPTVRLGIDVGIEQVIESMQRLGVNREIEPFPAMLLGAGSHTPLEMAQLYQPIANRGVRIPLRSIRSIHDSSDRVIARFPATERRVLDPATAFLINHALTRVVADGTAVGIGRRYPPDLQLAGKTGTTDDYRDSWFVGYSGDLLTVVWVGRDDNKPTGLTGAGGALRLWDAIMSPLPLRPNSPPPGDDIVFARVDRDSGLLADNGCERTVQLPFAAGFQPKRRAACSSVTSRIKSWFGIGTQERLQPVPAEQRNR